MTYRKLLILLVLCTAPFTDYFSCHAEEVKRDSTARRPINLSIRTNLLWDGLSEPNIGIEYALSKRWSIGANAGIKVWPRWLAWDWDYVNPKHWRNFAVVPEARFYFDQVYDGWFIGADLVYTHFNVGAVKFPFGVYSQVLENRLQGDFIGLGLFGGHSWWLGEHWRLEAEAGTAVGYNKADKFECAHCGAQIGETQGPVVVPKLGVNIAYNVRRRTQELIEEVIIPMPDTLLPPIEVPEPAPLVIVPPKVEEWKGVAGQLAPKHPVLRPSSEYRPYTPDRILRKEEGALYVFFELDQSQLKRSFTEQDRVRDNGPVLDEIIDITSSILKDTTSSVSCIQIIGLASIEGTQKRNQRLSDNRAHALQSYIQARLDVPDSLFETVGGGEAWTEFRDQVNDLILAGGGAELSLDQLQRVLELMDAEANPDRREARLKSLEGGAVYRKLSKHILAEQRNSGYIRVYFDYVPDANAETVNSAIAALEAGDAPTALQLLETVKEDPRSVVSRATALFSLDRTEEAVALLKGAIASGNKDAAALLHHWEEYERGTRAYQQYLQELNEYNNLIINQQNH